MSTTKLLLSCIGIDSFDGATLNGWDVIGERTTTITSVYTTHATTIRSYNLNEVLPIYDNLRVYQLKMLSDGYWIYGKGKFDSLYDVIKEIR